MDVKDYPLIRAIAHNPQIAVDLFNALNSIKELPHDRSLRKRCDTDELRAYEHVGKIAANALRKASSDIEAVVGFDPEPV